MSLIGVICHGPPALGMSQGFQQSVPLYADHTGCSGARRKNPDAKVGVRLQGGRRQVAWPTAGATMPGSVDTTGAGRASREARKRHTKSSVISNRPG